MKLYRTYICGPSLSRKIPKIEHSNVHVSRGKYFHSLFGWSTQSRNSWGHRHHVSYANELSAGFLCFHALHRFKSFNRHSKLQDNLDLSLTQ